MSINEESFKKIRSLILLAGVVLLVVLNISKVFVGIAYVIGILYPLLLGLCIAFVLNIPMSFFERHLFGRKTKKGRSLPKGLARSLSIAICFVIFLTLLLLSILYFIPKMTETLGRLSVALDENAPVWQEWLVRKFRKVQPVVNWLEKHRLSDIHWSDVILQLLSVARNGATISTKNYLELATKLLGRASNMVIAIAFSVYVCGAKEAHRKRFYRVLYGTMSRGHVARIRQILLICVQTFRRFITGQCLEALLDGVLVALIMTVAGMPYSFLLGIMAAVCSFIPMFGAWIAGAFGAVMLLTVSPARMVAFLIIYVLFRIFDDNFMYPRIMGNSIGMPSVYVLVGITIGGALFGFGGMLFFIPLTSLIFNLVSLSVNRQLAEKHLTVDSSGVARKLERKADRSAGRQTDEAVRKAEDQTGKSGHTDGRKEQDG